MHFAVLPDQGPASVKHIRCIIEFSVIQLRNRASDHIHPPVTRQLRKKPVSNSSITLSKLIKAFVVIGTSEYLRQHQKINLRTCTEISIIGVQHLPYGSYVLFRCFICLFLHCDNIEYTAHFFLLLCQTT